MLGISLDQVQPCRETIGRLIDGAARHIADAKIPAISTETRFGSAYTAIRMLADAGLHAHGYRPMTIRPGHHQTAIQTLPTTLGVDPRTIIRLDALRKQRNLTEYTGDIVPESALVECLEHAQSLYELVLEWLANARELRVYRVV
ncbi:MAG TPA: hypothetical protein VHZ53_11195 [Steroidobacteraceae bacterium]|nr:hypothetical protein [Steroidobacteraceae bacterium]